MDWKPAEGPVPEGAESVRPREATESISGGIQKPSGHGPGQSCCR